MAFKRTIGIALWEKHMPYTNNADFMSNKVLTETCAGLARYRELGVKKLESFVSQNPEHPQISVVLEDLEKLKLLQRVKVPTQDGFYRNYYILAEVTDGVTEKVSLIQRAHTLLRLRRLVDSELTLENYLLNRDNFELKTQALLKLPKHGKVKEVQRELIALTISELLGFKTTQHTMVNFNGIPALFIPFDEIRLMRKYVQGKNFKKHLVTNPSSYGEIYKNYSLIRALGEGLCADQTIDDFGMSLAFFYVCSDTDAFGGYNQNKALLNDKHLYIFDQLVMSVDKLALDSRFSMQPSQFLIKHTRHGQGRNRSLVEDSLFENKFLSVYQLQENCILIQEMLDKIIQTHYQNIQQLECKESKLNVDELSQLKLSREFAEDAELIKSVLVKRIENALNFLPSFESKLEDDVDPKTISLHAMMLEKLLNNPVLFADDGRPYRQPWTNPHTNKLQHILLRKGRLVELRFSHKPNRDCIAEIEKYLGTEIKLKGDTTLIVPLHMLLEINDRILYPEYFPFLKKKINYLDIDALRRLASCYPDDDKQLILEKIYEFIVDYLRGGSFNKQLKKIEDISIKVQEIKANTANQGLICNIQKRLHYAIQQKLQALFPIDYSGLMNNAFAAAVKLDRLTEFNQVCIAVLKSGYDAYPEFNIYLHNCICFDKNSNNYQQARLASGQLHQASLDIQNSLTSIKQHQSNSISA
jgi:hypothetical protein